MKMTVQTIPNTNVNISGREQGLHMSSSQLTSVNSSHSLATTLNTSPSTPMSGGNTVKQKKRLVSFDVFMKHVVVKPDGVDVSGIFSTECFHEWIANRKRKPKEPEESFRKALVAHVSGKDDRKPFSEEIEMKILSRLRESAPWPCFENSPNGANKIGERGLKKSSLGFHESKRRRLLDGGSASLLHKYNGSYRGLNFNQANQNRPGNKTYQIMEKLSERNVLARGPYVQDSYSNTEYDLNHNKSKMNVQQLQNSYPLQNISQLPNISGFNNIHLNQQFNSSLGNIQYGNGYYTNYSYGSKVDAEEAYSDPDKGNPNGFGMNVAIDPNQVRQQLKDFINLIVFKSAEKSNSNSCVLARCFANFFTTSELKHLVEVTSSNGVTLLNDTICYKIDLAPETSNHFFTKDFLYASTSSSLFKSSNPLGSLIMDLSFTVMEADDVSNRILKRNLSGVNLLGFYISENHRASSLRYILEGLLMERKVYSRLLVSVDRTIRVVLLELFLTKNRFLKSRIQDITENYHHLLTDDVRYV